MRKVFDYCHVCDKVLYDPADKKTVQDWYLEHDRDSIFTFLDWARQSCCVNIDSWEYKIVCYQEWSGYYWRWVWRPVDSRLCVKVDRSVSRALRCMMTEAAYDIGGLNLWINGKEYPIVAEMDKGQKALGF